MRYVGKRHRKFIINRLKMACLASSVPQSVCSISFLKLSQILAESFREHRYEGHIDKNHHLTDSERHTLHDVVNQIRLFFSNFSDIIQRGRILHMRIPASRDEALNRLELKVAFQKYR